MPTPRVELDVEPVPQIVAAALVHRAAPGVGQSPRRALEIVPAKRDVTGGRSVAEVDDDELARTVVAPSPRQQVVPAVVAVPARALGELPGAVAEDRIAQRFEQPLVEAAE